MEISGSTTLAEIFGALQGIGTPPKKRGRPAKAAEVEDETEEDETEEDDEETQVVPAKAPKKAKKNVEVEDEETEDEETEDEDEETEDEDEDEDEDEFATGDDLKKIKAALTAFSQKKKSKDAAVKVLKKFAPSSEKVPTGKVKELLKALKV